MRLARLLLAISLSQGAYYPLYISLVMLNVAGVRKIEVADAIACAIGVTHLLIDLLVSLKGFWEGQIQERVSGAR